MRSWVVWVCAIVLWSAGGSLEAAPSPWHLGPPEAVAASSGLFDPFVDSTSYEIGAELQFSPRRVRFFPELVPEVIPAAGLMAGAQGSLYVYGGFRLDVPLGRRWIFSPAWAAGLYNRSDSFDLGGPVEFRTSVELAYRLPGGSRLGVCLYHLSNAGLFTRNPGSESLVLTYSAGLRGR